MSQFLPGQSVLQKRKEQHYQNEKNAEQILALYKLYKCFKVIDNQDVKAMIKQQIDKSEQIILQQQADYGATMKNLIVKQLENIALQNHELRDQEINPQL